MGDSDVCACILELFGNLEQLVLKPGFKSDQSSSGCGE